MLVRPLPQSTSSFRGSAVSSQQRLKRRPGLSYLQRQALRPPPVSVRPQREAFLSLAGGSEAKEKFELHSHRGARRCASEWEGGFAPDRHRRGTRDSTRSPRPRPTRPGLRPPNPLAPVPSDSLGPRRPRGSAGVRAGVRGGGVPPLTGPPASPTEGAGEGAGAWRDSGPRRRGLHSPTREP